MRLTRLALVGFAFGLAACSQAEPVFDQAAFASNCTERLDAAGREAPICDCLAGSMAAREDALALEERTLAALELPPAEVSAALPDEVRPLGMACYNKVVYDIEPS
ncbi:MAG: hypothetical protein HXY25_03950 [Alphaproteobacteria bacterium]|nr:hypothetical protein [Alphaproteobacteria bacterium]